MEECMLDGAVAEVMNGITGALHVNESERKESDTESDHLTEQDEEYVRYVQDRDKGCGVDENFAELVDASPISGYDALAETD